MANLQRFMIKLAT